MKLRSFIKELIKGEEGGVIQWLLVLMAASIICAVIYANLKPGIVTSTGKMYNALTGD